MYKYLYKYRFQPRFYWDIVTWVIIIKIQCKTVHCGVWTFKRLLNRKLYANESRTVGNIVPLQFQGPWFDPELRVLSAFHTVSPSHVWKHAGRQMWNAYRCECMKVFAMCLTMSFNPIRFPVFWWQTPYSNPVQHKVVTED